MTFYYNLNIIALIAALNEEQTISSVVKGVLKYVNNVIVVDDGSKDTTFYKAKEAGAFVMRNEQPRGYDASLQKAFEEAQRRHADVIFTIDADGQHDTRDIPKILEPIIKGRADLVIGQRPRFTHLCERILAAYTKMRYGIKDPLCGFKAYSKKVCKQIGYFDTIGSTGTQLLIEAITQGFRVKFIPIHISERKDTSRFYIHRLRGNYNMCKSMFKILCVMPRR